MDKFKWQLELDLLFSFHFLPLFCSLKFLFYLIYIIFAYFLLKVNTKNTKVPTNKDFEWRWEAATLEIPFFIDVWEKGSHKVSPMCWMEWCSGQPPPFFSQLFMDCITEALKTYFRSLLVFPSHLLLCISFIILLAHLYI